MAEHPVVFVSYSHDDDTHKAWVIELSSVLRTNGVDVVLDRWDLRPGADAAVFMEEGVRDSERVVVVCSNDYVERANSGEGGVAYEKMIITAELVADVGTRKFIPIIRNSTEAKPLPTFLGSRFYIDFDDDSSFDENADLLLREIYSQDLILRPPLGEGPFGDQGSMEVPEMGDAQMEAEKVSSDAGFDQTWLASQFDTSFAGLTSIGFKTYMEVAFALAGDKPQFDQRSLQDAANASQINTFGWPIGIVIQGRAEYAPKPLSNGIYAELAIGGEQRESYDYWMARSNGDYFLLKSLFEDMRKPDEIFFNSRIVRSAESLMFCSNFYAELGVDPGTKVQFRIRYGGLAGRMIGSSNPRRWVIARTTSEDQVEAQITSTLSEINPNLVELTKELLSPLFMVFDFFEVGDEVYAQIVNDYKAGKTS